MPMMQMPTFKEQSLRMLEIQQPGIGGLNLKDLEYEQDNNQSPYMLNMMYRNGSFGKRYGQDLFLDSDLADKIYTTIYFDKRIIAHCGTSVYSIDPKTKKVNTITTGIGNVKGLFAIYSQNLYYICDSKIYVYEIDSTTHNYKWSEIEPYVPEVLINCDPKGPAQDGHSDGVDDYNIIGLKFKEIYHGDGTSTEYYIYGDDENIIDWSVNPTIEVDGEPTTEFVVDTTNKKITFNEGHIPQKGNLNVEITLTLKSSVMEEDRKRIMASKYYVTFGGNNNSCLFLAGGGNSKYFYSSAYDATYFPENNWAVLGNSEQDITGFGLQYNVLIVFKNNEMYSIYSYTQTSSTTIIEENYGLEAFKALLVNPRIGCDCPNTIQLINNQLTWFNSIEGVCTLVSTNIVDERNVRPISRNINKTNNMGIKGILDYDEDLETIQSVDFDNKYFLVFPNSGMCFMWDYAISPFTYTSSKVTDARLLDWFLFDKIYAKEFLKVEKDIFYITDKENFTKNLIELNTTFKDLDFENYGKYVGINAYYMTPFLQFNAVPYLKTIKNIYVQCRGDTSSVIDMYYYTDESATPEQDSESIRIGGKIWTHFSWDNFEWFVTNWANTFRRRCNLKKIQMASFYFENVDKYENGELISCMNRDMSITHISMDYQIVRTVR